MTKQELIRMLEPFDDDIEILMHANFIDSHPNVFYSWDGRYDSAVILLSTSKPNQRQKTVEIK